MGRLLRSEEESQLEKRKEEWKEERKEEKEEEWKELEELFSISFDYSNSCLLFPVRHHSPACSVHLKKVIEEYKPEIILIEGPENATELIEFMVSKNTKAPFCIYLSYDDKEGKISGEPDKYRAYYPFLDYSPELVALREADKANITCKFIDLNYGEKLLNSQETAERRERYDNDDFSLGHYYELLTQKTGCRNFNELWEKLFEVEGLHKDTESFVKSIFTYCYFSRCFLPEEERKLDGDMAREQVMMEHIDREQKQFSKILVVTGGMHTITIAKHLLQKKQDMLEKKDKLQNESQLQNKNNKDSEKPLKIIRIKKEDTPAYLMPFSFEESDRASGYESGMAFPFFYQKVWEFVQKKKKFPFQEAVLSFIINTASDVRKKQVLSIADEMQSYYMAHGLASLRGKEESGAFELLDSVKSSFIKSEINSFYQPALKKLIRLMTGMAMGSIDTKAGVPPIVTDFYAWCKQFRIQTNTTLKKETKLDVYNKPDHREKSRFFRQMEFLNTNFCTYQKSQEDNGTSGRILLRESWEYRYSPAVQAALIQVSVYGGTLRQACLALMIKQIKEEHHTAASLAQLLQVSEQMGIFEIFGELMEVLEDVISSDADFISVMDCFECLETIKRRTEQLTREEKNTVSILDLEKIRVLALNRSFTLLYTVLQIKKEEEDKVCKKIKYLYQYFINNKDLEEEEQFLSQLQSIYEDNNVNAALLGVSAGVLLKKERLELDKVFQTFESYIYGAEEMKKLGVSFLKGFFLTAKDVIFVDDRLLLLLNDILKEAEGELFLQMLPDFRLAFTYFLPFETDRIAKRVTELYGVSLNSFYEQPINPIELEEAIDIDHYCEENYKKWLLEE